MTDISELEGRITAALDRIGQGLDALGPKPDESHNKQIVALNASLDDEQTANAQLRERVKAIKQKRDSEVSELRAEIARLFAQVETGDAGIARMRKVSHELRMNNTALREAVAEGVTEPHLINKSMMAELEAVRAAHAADRAELDAILTELAPMVETVENTANDATEENTDA